MKKRLLFINNRGGFILPYTLFIATIVLLIIITNITIYTRDIQTTHKYVEHIKIQTLFQMGREKFKQQLPDLDTNNKVAYTFPHGYVEIDYTVFETTYHLLFSVYTEDNSVYKVVNILETYPDEQ